MYKLKLKKKKSALKCVWQDLKSNAGWRDASVWPQWSYGQIYNVFL